MQYPKVVSATAIDNHTLVVEFDNNEKRKYDVTPLLKKEMFAPLKNPAFFKAVRVEQGGYAVAWNNEIDISEYELWRHGQEMPSTRSKPENRSATHHNEAGGHR
ncbi:DUF2442 domain-containing protein [Desulfonatronum lacustre]|uniref:DUF2442 domain-containing protein n=1 Tax=Desulfonatronum lacustre TaxID=66849 RepID=UPI000A000381|nr:DUF2442 domain-containing protein [Desulfonatronum lacustre]